MKRAKGFTLIELCIVLVIIAILASVTVMYGRTWVNQYRLSNFLRATEAGVRVTKMQAITQGRDTALIISTNSITTDQLLSTSDVFKGTYAALGPYLLTNTDNYTNYFPVDTQNTNTETRVYYLLYNSKLYSLSDVSTDTFSALDSGDGYSFNIKFNSRGFPYVYVGSSPPSPRPYQARTLKLENKQLKHTSRTFTITPTGKIE